MKVRVVLIVDVDKAIVEAEYGETYSADDVRDFVRSESQSAVESALRQVDAKVEVKP